MDELKIESIFDSSNGTTVAFGSGTIQMGVCGTPEYVQVYLNDSGKIHEIGIDTEYWEPNNGRNVILMFNKIESIEVLERTLAQAKTRLRIMLG